MKRINTAQGTFHSADNTTLYPFPLLNVIALCNKFCLASWTKLLQQIKLQIMNILFNNPEYLDILYNDILIVRVFRVENTIGLHLFESLDRCAVIYNCHTDIPTLCLVTLSYNKQVAFPYPNSFHTVTFCTKKKGFFFSKNFCR